MVYRVKQLFADGLWITRGGLQVTPLTRVNPFYRVFFPGTAPLGTGNTVGGSAARMFGGVVKGLRLSL
jgi:hypothetical protein